MIGQAPTPLPDSGLAAVSDIDWGAVLRWEELLPDLLRAVFVGALAFVGYRLVKLLTARLEREVRAEDPVVKRMREQRARTLASLVNSIALITIAALASLTILSFFINIGPLLAGVGVFGLAISFGAQSLVKDVIGGMFILAEGQFGIGDVVRLGDTAGAVERISLRTTVLRDLHGAVHVVPNGEITRVSNLTRAWSRAVLDIGVAYRADVDRVIAVLGELGREIAGDPEWKALLVETPQVLGIEEFAASSVIVRMVATTLPLKQWDVARELRRRIKKRFDTEGIELPLPHVILYWGEGQMPAAPAGAGNTPGGHTAPTSGARHGTGPERD